MLVKSPAAANVQPALTLVVAQRLPVIQAPVVQDLRAPNGVTLIPTENVLLLTVDLPSMPAAQRRAAIGFAVEDRIAQPLDQVQVVVGPQMAAGTWLVAVTAKTVLAGLPTGKADNAIWPDVLMLPAPRSGWSVWASAERAVVRLPDGTGFATRTAMLAAFWAAAGAPAVTLFGGALPATIPVTARAELPLATDPSLAGFDLRDRRRQTGGGLSLLKGAWPLLVVGLVAALAHGALLAADVLALSRLAGQREAEVRAVLNVPSDADLETALAQAFAARQPVGTGGVLVLLARAFGALGAEKGRVSVQSLRYSAADDAAILTLEASDLSTLQAVETALNAEGMNVTAGAATTSDGAAEVQMTLTGGGA